MRTNIARFIEDRYYTVLIHIRSLLERLRVLHTPSAEKLQQEIETMMADF